MLRRMVQSSALTRLGSVSAQAASFLNTASDFCGSKDSGSRNPKGGAASANLSLVLLLLLLFLLLLFLLLFLFLLLLVLLLTLLVFFCALAVGSETDGVAVAAAGAGEGGTTTLGCVSTPEVALIITSSAASRAAPTGAS